MPDNLPPHTTNSYANLMKATTPNASANKRQATHIPDTLPTPDTTNPAPLHLMEVNDHKTLLHQTIYYTNQIKTDHLTAKHLCQHIHNGFTPKHLSRVCQEDEDTPILAIPFEVTWQATWLSEDTIRSLPNGNSAIQNYEGSKLPKKTNENGFPNPPHRQCGWHPRYTSYTTHPINPDLDAVPTGRFEVTSHPPSLDSVLLHAPDGRLISPISKARLQKLIEYNRIYPLQKGVLRTSFPRWDVTILD